MYHFNFISSFPSFLILNVHPISSNHEDSEKKTTKNTRKKAKEWHIPDTSLTHPWHTSPNLKRKIPPTKNLGFQNQWIWPSCPGCPPGPWAIFQDPKALVFMAENLLFNGQKNEKKILHKDHKSRVQIILEFVIFLFLVILHAESPHFCSAELLVTKISM